MPLAEIQLRKKRKSGEALVVQQDLEACLSFSFFPHCITCIDIHLFCAARCWRTASGALKAIGKCYLAMNAMWVDVASLPSQKGCLRCLAPETPTHLVRSVIFVYLNSCKRFTLNLPPETLEATCLVLFCQFLVQKAQVRVGSIYACSFNLCRQVFCSPSKHSNAN